MTDSKFIGNPAISDPEVHEQVVDMFNRIAAVGENKKYEWEIVPIEEDKGIPEFYDIVWDSEEFYNEKDKDELIWVSFSLFSECTDSAPEEHTPWETKITKTSNSMGISPRKFSSKEVYDEYILQRKDYRKQLAPFIKGYAKVPSALYQKKSLEFQKYDVQEFDQLLKFFESTTANHSIILNRFKYSFTDVDDLIDMNTYTVLEEKTLDQPKTSFTVEIALVDK